MKDLKKWIYHPLFLANFPKTYKRQTHLRPISVIPEKDFSIEWYSVLLEDIMSTYRFDKYGKIVPGCTWGVNMWPSTGVFTGGYYEDKFQELMTCISAHYRTKVDAEDIDGYTINPFSKMGYPYCTVDSKVEVITNYLREMGMQDFALNMVLNRNQPDLETKVRSCPCVLGDVTINNHISFKESGVDYIYDFAGNYRTMRMRLAFNFSIDSLITLVADQAIHSRILRDEQIMHHDMSRINGSNYLRPFISEGIFVDSFDVLKHQALGPNKHTNLIVLAADCVRFDNQITKARQIAYAEGIGSTYRRYLENMLDQPFILQGDLMGDSFTLEKKERNLQFLADIPFITTRDLPHTNWVCNQRWYIKHYDEIQLGSGLSLVAPIAKVLFSSINAIYRDVCDNNDLDSIIETLGSDDDINKPNNIITDSITRLLKNRKIDSISADMWLARYGLIPLSYGDDQIWFGYPINMYIYYLIARNFIKIDTQKEPIFLGFSFIKGVGFKLTMQNYLKSFLFPEHDFGSYFRKYPAVSIHYKDLDYLRLSNIDATELDSFWSLVKKATGFDRYKYVSDHLQEQMKEIEHLSQLSYEVLNKRYMLNKEELLDAGLAVPVNYSLLENVYERLIT